MLPLKIISKSGKFKILSRNLFELINESTKIDYCKKSKLFQKAVTVFKGGNFSFEFFPFKLVQRKIKSIYLGKIGSHRHDGLFVLFFQREIQIFKCQNSGLNPWNIFLEQKCTRKSSISWTVLIRQKPSLKIKFEKKLSPPVGFKPTSFGLMLTLCHWATVASHCCEAKIT